MWNALLLVLCNLVGNNRQATIQLHRVAVDDFAIILSRDLYRQLPAVVSDMKHDQTYELYIRFTSPRRTDYGDKRLTTHLRHFDTTECLCEP